MAECITSVDVATFAMKITLLIVGTVGIFIAGMLFQAERKK